jgi:PAS domain-containing protein
VAVEVELVPFLPQLRDLYLQPRGPERFEQYLDLLRSQSGEMALPISSVNPMAKPHVLARVEQLLDLEAEHIAIQAAREGAQRLRNLDARLGLIAIVCDDARGGWTNRAFAEFSHRYEREHEVRRGWATVILWSSEEPSPDLVHMRTLETLYRTVDELEQGAVRTLRAILKREGRTMHFAGHARRYDDATVQSIRTRVEPHLESHAAPVVLAALYGDAIAQSLGYPPLGIPDRGGYELALANAEVPV